MKGSDQVIQFLNELLTGELTAINVYFIHGRMCDNWGYERLGKRSYDDSLDEMRHADKIIQRILYLGGLPNLQRLGKVLIGETVPEQLRIGLKAEQAGVTRLNEGIELCRGVADNGTGELLRKLLESAESSVSWLEAQLALIEKIGEGPYLALQVKSEGG